MPNNKPGSRLIKAAGGVAWRPGPGRRAGDPARPPEKYDDWSLPKGKTEPGEPLPVTAVREVLEEGGARLALGRRLASVRYNVGGRPKRVHYWAASRAVRRRARGPELRGRQGRRGWRPPARWSGSATPTTTGCSPTSPRRPAQTVPLILLRHAKAVAKSGWKRADVAARSTTPAEPTPRPWPTCSRASPPAPRLISSTAARCTETLRPLAELTGARGAGRAVALPSQPVIPNGSGRLSPAITALVARRSPPASRRCSAPTGRTSPSCRPRPWPPSASASPPPTPRPRRRPGGRPPGRPRPRGIPRPPQGRGTTPSPPPASGSST